MRALWQDWENVDPKHVDHIQLIQHRDNEWVIYMVHYVGNNSRSSDPICEGKDEIDIRKNAHKIARRFNCQVIESGSPR